MSGFGVLGFRGVGFWGFLGFRGVGFGGIGLRGIGLGSGIAVFVYVCRAWRAKSAYSLGETNGLVSQPIGLRLGGLGFRVQARGL